MYIIELFIKWLNKNKRGDGANPENFFREENANTEKEIDHCEHQFMPIDSTEEVLACIKCGYVIKKNK